MAHHVSSAAELQSLFASTTYVVVDFFADWCPPCKTIAPIYEGLAAKHSIPGILAFAKVNVEHVKELSAEYQVTAMPTFMFFKNGTKVSVDYKLQIQGADPGSLMTAVNKLSGLAKKRAAERA